MGSVTLSQSTQYRLADPGQDWHGWKVFDTAGTLIGRVADFIIDTEQARVASIVLDTGDEVSIDDLMMGDRSLVAWTRAASLSSNAPSLPLFEQGTLDVVERVEVAVLRKRPTVVEELVITHEVVDSRLSIRTTLRARDVTVASSVCS
jgi:PRC-barrel domain